MENPKTDTAIADRAAEAAEAANWGKGWTRWANYLAEHGTTDIPSDYPDTELVSWSQQQRESYWKWKRGEKTYLGGETFTMLSRFGFDFGVDPSSDKGGGASGGSDAIEPQMQDESMDKSDHDDSDSKPSAEKKRSGKWDASPSKKRKRVPITDSHSESEDNKPSKKSKAKAKTAKKSPPKKKKPLARNTRSAEVSLKNDSHEDVEVSKDASMSEPELEAGDTSPSVFPSTPTRTSILTLKGAVTGAGRTTRSNSPLKIKVPERDHEHSESDSNSPSLPPKKRVARSTMSAVKVTPSKKPIRTTVTTPITSAKKKAAHTLAPPAVGSRRSPRKGKVEEPVVVVVEAKEVDTSDDDDHKEKEKPTRRRSPKRGTPSTVAVAKGASGNNKKSKTQKKATPPKKTRSSSTPPSEKVTYECRRLSRLVADQDEATIAAQVKEEFADLLESEEPVVGDKENNVTDQQAEWNKLFEDRFLDFLVFKKIYGHGIVPKMYEQNKALGRWVSKVRRWKRQEDPRLTESRLDRLERAGFVWEAKSDPEFWKIQYKSDKFTDFWENKFQDLLQYKEKFGDCLVPKDWPEHPSLARWVCAQRKHYRCKQNNEYNTLDDEKERRLKEVGFVFNSRQTDILRSTTMKRLEPKWEACFQKLVTFSKKYGHTMVPRRFKHDQTLASWVIRQRSLYKKGDLPEDRCARLREIGFAFYVAREKNVVIRVDGPVPPAAHRSLRGSDDHETPEHNTNQDTTEKETPTSEDTSEGSSKKQSILEASEPDQKKKAVPSDENSKMKDQKEEVDEAATQEQKPASLSDKIRKKSTRAKSLLALASTMLDVSLPRDKKSGISSVPRTSNDATPSGDDPADKPDGIHADKVVSETANTAMSIEGSKEQRGGDHSSKDDDDETVTLYGESPVATKAGRQTTKPKLRSDGSTPSSDSKILQQASYPKEPPSPPKPKNIMMMKASRAKSAPISKARETKHPPPVRRSTRNCDTTSIINKNKEGKDLANAEKLPEITKENGRVELVAEVIVSDCDVNPNEEKMEIDCGPQADSMDSQALPEEACDDNLAEAAATLASLLATQSGKASPVNKSAKDLDSNASDQQVKTTSEPLEPKRGAGIDIEKPAGADVESTTSKQHTDAEKQSSSNGPIESLANGVAQKISSADSTTSKPQVDSESEPLANGVAQKISSGDSTTSKPQVDSESEPSSKVPVESNSQSVLQKSIGYDSKTSKPQCEAAEQPVSVETSSATVSQETNGRGSNVDESEEADAKHSSASGAQATQPPSQTQNQTGPVEAADATDDGNKTGNIPRVGPPSASALDSEDKNAATSSSVNKSKKSSPIESPTKKSQWKCKYCGSDDHSSFVEATAHETICAKLNKLSVSEGKPFV